MYICYNDIARRSFGQDVKSTADSFKSWDTCMDNKTCKIVAIVGIVLACLVAFWIISTLVRCLCMGFSCLEALCCCCCRSASKGYTEKQHPYTNPNMYPPQPQPAPMYQQQYQGYREVDSGYNQPNNHTSTNQKGYQPVDPFQDTRTSYKGHF
ncbi:hypothetical protein CLIB1444_04S08240 [[Candida] jaroonii]|uniref:Uncharacterized protein n=1 Tax=[Candida] jaroonii TaxID=467808 RepID=A0ACA9Y6Z9_9ASCO|nr:hypothetical protein CLIB1444_04S08240 [[Candida] jaroonii]